MHTSPSTIGTDTIRKSKGKIPNKFLLGCGLIDLDIECAKLAAPELSEKEIIDITHVIHDLRSRGRYPSVFISYSSKDQDFACKLYYDLQDNGVPCWFALQHMKGGRKILPQIFDAIQTHERTLAILSENSMNSDWDKTEIASAMQKEKNENKNVFFPISLVGIQEIKEWKWFDADTGRDLAKEIREYSISDFSNWQDAKAYQLSFERLLRDLKTH
jgi:hypothetical protein